MKSQWQVSPNEAEACGCMGADLYVPAGTNRDLECPGFHLSFPKAGQKGENQKINAQLFGIAP
jgi:hypothetical protein